MSRCGQSETPQQKSDPLEGRQRPKERLNCKLSLPTLVAEAQRRIMFHLETRTAGKQLHTAAVFSLSSSTP